MWTYTVNFGQQECRSLYSKVNPKRFHFLNMPSLVKPCELNVRMFGAGPDEKNDDGDSGMSGPPPATTWMARRQGLQLGRRRSLSPLERISQLLPDDALSSEVAQLREQPQNGEKGEDIGTHSGNHQYVSNS